MEKRRIFQCGTFTRIAFLKPGSAVGTSNGKNPFAIVVPCHRVVTADGKLGGYAGGLENKRKLLHFEARARLDSKKRKL